MFIIVYLILFFNLPVWPITSFQLLIPLLKISGLNVVLSDPIEENGQEQQQQQQQQQEEQQQRQDRIEEDHQAASILDEMIARMQQEQDAQIEMEGAAAAGADDAALMPPPNLPGLRPSTPGRDRGGMRWKVQGILQID